MAARGVVVRLSTVLVWLCLFILCSPIQAQGDAAPIQIGQNAVSELTAEIITVKYALTASGGETATVQVLALSAGFVPHFRVIHPAGVEILAVANPDGLTSLSASASFPDAGNYLIEISGENDTTGQFVLSLQPGASIPDAVELLINQPVPANVGSQAPVRVYRFNTTPDDALILTILGETPGAGVLISLFDEDAGKTIASNDASLSGVAYRLPAQERHYRLEVRAGGADDSAFSICLGVCGGGLLSAESPAAPQVVEVAETPELVVSSCTVASNTGGGINVRTANGTQYAIVGNLTPSSSLPALGQNASNGGWYQVSVNGQIGWVSASVTRLEGDCGNLASVAAPANAQLAPTQPPAPAQPPAPTQPTGGGTAPTATPSATLPSAPATLTPTTPPLPDLVISDIARAISEDETSASISVLVSNIGAGDSGTFTIWICDGNNCTGANIAGLASGIGNGVSVTVAHTTTFSGYNATVDYYNNVVESNEDNNYVSRTYQE